MKTNSKIGGYIIRGTAYAVLLSLAFVAASSALNSPNKWYKSTEAAGGYGSTAKSPSQPRTLSFAERVAFQQAIEDIYWRHRIWPRNDGENPDRKPALDAVMSQAQLEKKVENYLRDSLVLEDYWQKPITAEQLQAEMDRMAQHTRQPEVLRELFAALGNDPAVIAECLARPILAQRLIADLSVQGQTRRVESPHTDTLRTMSVVTTLGQFAYTLPKISDAADPPCTDDTWTATTTANAPLGRAAHTAVWTGSEMIVWGGFVVRAGPGTYFNTGGRYNPSTDSWTATSTTNAPSARAEHTAVWTGSEMIVWGGGDNTDFFNTGGRYNPSTDSWAATSLTNAPSTRTEHTAVWTGSEMIVWGGLASGPGDSNTGGRYNPSTDTWTKTNVTNAPSARRGPTAVWTSSEMIVWGGFSQSAGYFNTGGRYNPSTNTWTATSLTNAPTARFGYTAVWTGSEMIIWGGAFGGQPTSFNTGARYNPSTDSWTATSTTNAPYRRYGHTAVWTGSEMIVWGGAGQRDDGGKYFLTTDSWIATSTANAPSARVAYTAVWTGSEMIVWGGNAIYPIGTTNTGGRYCALALPAQLANTSTRAFVQTGDNATISGFIVQGAQAKSMIIRAIGPELTQYGVPNALANPTLELHDSVGVLIASNDNWQFTFIGGIITQDQGLEIRNSGYAPGNLLESAIIADLPPGNYTAIVRGVNNTIGVALVEVYDLSPETNSILSNISTRSFVRTADNVMIGGFILQGTQPKRVIIRAIGPELSAPPFNIPNALANPTLELHNAAGALIASNDNWQFTIIGGIITHDQSLEIRDSGHAPGNPLESAIIADLSPGNYTAIVRDVNNTTGVGLVEVYDLGQ
jgi:N-acetylneuraminic acid mutarotase